MTADDCGSKAEALKIVADAGYTIIPENDGGAIDHYDAEDGPAVYGYEAYGMGAFGITVEE